ncbi:MAG: adenylate/guanylate cyclase domain-containing protein [Actinomycetota bacterium]|nr:adenylate/guanylate cyclase domain-containing protein [Actinomycetota bacterium]
MLFADLVGFTAMAESADPEQVKAIVDRGFERLVRDIADFGGRVDKIIGDAVVALFGAPVANEDDPERAVRAALQMQQTLASYAMEVGLDIRMRIGVNTGEVLTGPMRAGGEYTAVGDVVNTANRLQQAAQPGQVLVGPQTFEATREVVVYEPVGPLNARGREEVVPAWLATDTLLLPGRRPRSWRGRLVGRDAEITLLRHALRVTFRRGRAALLLLFGEAGVGKTRLADELAEWAEGAQDALVLEGRCVPYGEANVWYPLGAALREACDLAPDAPLKTARDAVTLAVARAIGEEDGSPRTAQVTRGLLSLMGYEAMLRDVEPQVAREEAARAVADFFEGLAADQPVLVRLADLHWADDLVLEMLDQLLDALARSPFALVATARHVIDRRWSPRSGRHNDVVLNVDPLDGAAAGELLDQLVGGIELDDEVREALLARSGGNPFFLEELVALLTRTGEERPVDIDSELPETLRGLVAARLDRLNPTQRSVIDDAAVFGRSGPVAAIARMGKPYLDGNELPTVLEALDAADLLEVDERRWAFRSDLVRDVAYGMLTKADRARRHAEIAGYIERHLGGAVPDDNSVDPIAYHYGMAARLAGEVGIVDGLPEDLNERALSWIAEAANRAKQAEIYLLAGRLFHQAIDLAGDEPSPLRLEYHLGRAEARWALFELEGARADIEAALADADALGDDQGRAQALLALAEVQQREGALDEARLTLDEALERFVTMGDQQGEAEALRLAGMTLMYQGAYPEAETSATEALERFRTLGDRRGEAWALQSLAWISYLTGHIAEAETRLDESVARFAEIGDTAGLGWANGVLAFTRFHQGDFAEAERLAEMILPDAHERGDRFGECMMLLLLALVLLWSGRTEEAVERAEEARALFRRIGDAVGLGQAQAVHGRALVATGRIEEGFKILEEGFNVLGGGHTRHEFGALIVAATAVQIGDVHRAETQLGLLLEAEVSDEFIGSDDRTVAAGLTLLQLGRVEEAASLLHEVAERRAGTEVSPYALAALAFAQVVCDDAGGAVTTADRVHGLPRATYLDRLMAHMAAGLAHGVRGDASEVIATFGAARQVADVTGDRTSQAIVRLAEAHALEAVHATSARSVRREADGMLRDLEIGAAGWVRVFELAIGPRDAATLAS